MRQLLRAAAALLPLLAAAQERPSSAEERRVYAFAAAGPAFALDGETKAAGFERGDALEVGAGMRLAPHVAVELGGGYVRFAHERSFLSRTYDGPDAPIEEITFERTLSATPLLASVRVSGRWGPVELHARGGAGAYLASEYGTVTSSLSPPWSFELADTCFGVHAAAGALATLADGLLLGFEGRWVKATARFRLAPDPTTTTSSSRDAERRLDSLVVSATAGYRF